MTPSSTAQEAILSGRGPMRSITRSGGRRLDLMGRPSGCSEVSFTKRSKGTCSGG